MKTLGNAIDGGKIIVFTEDEFLALMHLVASVEGKSLDRIRVERGYQIESNIETALIAITEFAINQATVTEAIEQLKVVKDTWFDKAEDASS